MPSLAASDLLLHIQPESPVPIYEQIVAQITFAIASGALEPGAMIPSVRDLAGRVLVHPNTVARAFQELERRGVLKGSIFALLGDNGAGKTTTIRMLTGLLQPDKGYAAILGQDCWQAATQLRHHVGYVPERPRFYDWMTVAEIGWFTACFHWPRFLPRYQELVGRFQLEP